MSHVANRRPSPDEHAPYYGNYVKLVTEDDILGVLAAQLDDTVSFLRTVPEVQAVVLHSPYMWTIKQVVGHLTDGERIFAYRALRIGRGDATPLPGFDENTYARAAEFSGLPLLAIVDEFESVRRSTLTLFRNLAPESWVRVGEANGHPVSVRAVAYIMAGHVRHHMNIVRKRLTGATPSA